MSIEILKPSEIGRSDLAAWRAFQRATPELRNPFLAPEFALAVARERRKVRVARLSERGEPQGYFAFEGGRSGIGRPLAAGLSDCQGVVQAPGADWDAEALLAACGLASIEFDHLAPGQAPFAPYVRGTEPSPIVELGGGYRGYLDARRAGSRSFRRLMSRREALYADHHDVSFEYHSVDEAVLSTLFAWKSNQYRRTGRVDRFAKPWIRGLVSRLMHVDTEDFSGVLACLRVGGQPIAIQAALATPTVLSLWFPAYSPDFSRYSPGNVLRLELIQAAAERGIECVDMGKGFSVHKEHLKTGEIEVAEARIERRSARAFLHRAYREPPRKVERFVLDHPRLRVAARRTLAGLGRARVAAGGR